MSSQVREGYKQTEIGVVPKDWKVQELGSLGKFKNGINKGSEDFGHGSPFVNLMDVFGVSSISKVEHLGLVNSNEAEKKVYNLKEGDVLFIRSSVKPSGVGLTTVVTKDLLNTVYSGFLIRFRDSRNLETNFKKYCFSEERFRQGVISNSTVSANTNINQDNLKKLIVAYPKSWVEQRSIAQALSDVDALIVALDKLIAKNRDLKTATMQQLLTGKKRLPGFGEGQGYKESEIGLIPEDWEVKPLGTICKVNQGLQIAIESRLKNQTSNAKKYITIQSINSNLYSEYIENYPLSVCCVEDDVLMTRTGNTGIVVTGVNGVFHNNFFKINFDREKLDKGYFVYYLSSNKSQKIILEKAGTSTIPDLNHSDFYSIQIPLPSFEEQRAIATVLSDMGKAISALESRLAKTQAIKQGMMQELLTGRIRLQTLA